MPVLNNWQATPPLVLLVGMPADSYTTVDAIRLYNVSERTLRRRIAKGIPGATKNAEGAWLLPATWLEEFGLRAGGSTNKSEPATSGMPIDMPTDKPPAVSQEERISARAIAEQTAADMAKQRAEADEIRERRAAAREARERTNNMVAGEGGTLSRASDMPPGMPATAPIGTELEDLRREKDARIDHLRDQVADLRVEMAGTTVDLRYAQIAEKRVTAERDRANSDLEQTRSELERIRADLIEESSSRKIENATAETMINEKESEIERLRTKMSELRKDLATSRGEARLKYRRQRRKDQKRAAKAKRKAGE